MIKLHLMGVLSDWTEQVEQQFACTEQFNTPAKIRSYIQQQAPDISEHLQPPFVLLAVNQQVETNWDMSLKQGDEIAFMPPFTGG